MCSFQILQLMIVNSRPQSVEARVSELRTNNRPIFIIIRYIYICQQHGGLLGGIQYRCNISVNFVSLLLFSSAKNLPAIRSLFES